MTTTTSALDPDPLLAALPPERRRRVLVTGVTGYIGGRLVERLLERGHHVRALVRDPRRVADRPWASRVEIVRGDLSDAASSGGALGDADAAYYLVHSMGAGDGYAARDRAAAHHFADAAAGARLVVYLGGLLPPGAATSEHLRSRAEVGAILRDRLPTTELRAGPIIGSGSASFEMVRYLTERLPAMIAPRWILNQVQPVGVRDVLRYLVLALDRPALGVVDVGGDRLTFMQMMHEYARARGLRRIIVPVPVLAPSLAARWVGLVTPIPNALARPLVKGIVEPVLADTTRARREFPEVEPMTYRAAVELALEKTGTMDVVTRWSGALGEAPAGGPPAYELRDREGLIRETHTVLVRAAPARVFEAFASLGGARGWLVWGWAWELRGLLDRLVGGPGLRRGRRHPSQLLAGEALDFWRVEASQPPTLLRLRAEMRVPGRAWLQFTATAEGDGTRLAQTAFFDPVGLPGVLYWYLLYPLHRLIFRDMVRAVGGEAERLARADAPAPIPA